MQGALDPSDGGCDSAQNGRGGMFFVLEDRDTTRAAWEQRGVLIVQAARSGNGWDSH